GLRVGARLARRAAPLARRAALGARLPAAARRGRAAPQAHADARLRLRRHGRPRAAHQRTAGARGAPAMTGENGAVPTRDAVLAQLRPADRVCLTTLERPEGHAAG